MCPLPRQGDAWGPCSGLGQPGPLLHFLSILQGAGLYMGILIRDGTAEGLSWKHMSLGGKSK